MTSLPGSGPLDAERGVSSAAVMPRSRAQVLIGPVRSMRGLRIRSETVTIVSRMVEADDLLERRRLRECVRREPSRHDRRLDAARVEAAGRPVAGDREVV